MCTVSYVPSISGLIFTSNRDESKLRSADHLIKYEKKDKMVVFPPDSIGGTWIGCNSQGEIVCLLNGAFVRHKHRPPYRYSRGLIVRAFLESNKSINELLYEIDLDGIEPFTLIYASTEKLIELRWDERIKHIRSLDKNSSHVWSSSTLYSDDVQLQKRQYFQDHLSANKVINGQTMMNFHQSKPFGDGVNDLVMDRDFVATISITQILKTDQNITINYHNLLNDSLITSWL